MKGSKSHLARLHALPCAACFRQGSTVPATEAHHLEAYRDEWSDFAAIPLCAMHHDQLHELSRRGFWQATKLSEVDLLATTIYLITEYGQNPRK